MTGLWPQGAEAPGGALSRVLAEIRRQGETARVDIAQALDLSPATVSAAAASLLDAGLICEIGAETAAGGRGRPRVRLKVRPTARHFAGAKLNDGALTVGVMNFAGVMVSNESLPLDPGPTTSAHLADRLEAGLTAALAAAGLAQSDLTALGLGVPGFVDLASGYCHWSPLLLDAPTALAPGLEARLGLPVFVDNDANLAALAEIWFGYGRHERDFLVVTVEHGLGLGIVLDGKLFRGSRGLGAEFGHTKVQHEGALCRCGQRGCLEAYTADYAIAREAPAALARHGGGDPATPPLEQLAALAEAGDEVATAIFHRAGRMLGLGIANLANLLDPPLIVLAGARMRHHDLLAKETQVSLDANALRANRPPLQLRVHRWGDELWARGAGSLAIDCAFGIA